MEHDRAGFEEREVAFLVHPNLAERMPREMRGVLQCLERDKTDLVRLVYFLEPARARIAREAFAAVGGAFEGPVMVIVTRRSDLGYV